ncbi:hypothetical protein [Scale drop disease virus]|uniref:ORF_079R n=1 Tax=Scale drop disease virus TaxID=1697349 RepID=A0A0K1L6J2_9VIRU|nr:ORF_079R [Scale drop disease virus]AKU37494.1 ORF_079R [Scale drop disease virus]QLI60753.1 hypothetical protein [Scale drop disease virus]QXJ13671.1 ORF079R [Scale drop disease virus]UNH60702.1 hypothetical protein SDDV_ORF033 [Scale drop disease virus]
MNRNLLVGGGCPYPHFDPIVFPDSKPTSYTTVNANKFATPHTSNQNVTTASEEVAITGMDNHRIYTALRQGDHVLFMVKGVLKTTADDYKVYLYLKDTARTAGQQTEKITEFSTARISTDYVIINGSKLWRVEFPVNENATFELKLKCTADTSKTYQIHSLEEAFIVSRNVE